jgi:Gametolysin peptidase M11
MRWGLAVLLAALALVPAASSADSTVLRLLVVRLTWNAEPLNDATTIQKEVASADNFYRRSSFGRLRLEADVTPVLDDFAVPSRCFDRAADAPSGLGAFAAAARTAAVRAGVDVTGYDRYIYLTPERVCGAGGLGVGEDVLLAGTGFDAGGLVHELGHTLGLPHAASATCATCGLSEYGDTFSPMGSGVTDFSAWEKNQLGWLSGIRRADTAGGYDIAPVDAESAQPQALVVPVAAGELWIEHLTLPRVIIRIVRPRRTYGERTVLLASGEQEATVKGIVRVRRLGPTTLQLAWTDTTPPSRPGRLSISAAGGSVSVAWRGSADDGSGVRAYRVRIDGRALAVVTSMFAVVPARPGRSHLVAVTAIDRAGCESRPSIRRFRGR